MECCIIVLPDVAAAQSFLWGSLVSRRIECVSSMHDWTGVASDASAAIFRGTEDVLAVTAAGLRFFKRGDATASTVKCGGRKPAMMRVLRTKAKSP
jgi:hypothetical protein